jgi:hypothetical protein
MSGPGAGALSGDAGRVLRVPEPWNHRSRCVPIDPEEA